MRIETYAEELRHKYPDCQVSVTESDAQCLTEGNLGSVDLLIVSRHQGERWFEVPLIVSKGAELNGTEAWETRIDSRLEQMART